MGSARAGESKDGDRGFGFEADLEEAVSILRLHTARAKAAIADQAAARAEVVARLDAALHVVAGQRTN